MTRTVKDLAPDEKAAWLGQRSGNTHLILMKPKSTYSMSHNVSDTISMAYSSQTNRYGLTAYTAMFSDPRASNCA